MKHIPKISVIMSVYNGERYLKEAIDSVINQTFTDWELIVVNDCSTDNTSAILEEYRKIDVRIKVITNEVNLRLPSSLNKAVDESCGKYIARMDADDICLPNRLEIQYNYMESNRDISISSCRYMTLKNGVFYSGGGGGRCESKYINSMLIVTNPILHPGVIADSEVMKALKYDTSLTCTEDLELWSRAARNNYKLEILDEYLMIYRIHDKQITGTTLKRQYNEVAEIEKKYFPEFFGTMSADEIDFYIHGIYFREQIDIEKFCEFKKKLNKISSKTKRFSKKATEYTMLEILAEYKRCGISKRLLLTGLLRFNPFFAVKEVLQRKKRAANDGRRCIYAAEKIGLIHSGGKTEFPKFTRK